MWKQFLLVGLLLVASLILVLVVGYAALATELVTPPAVVPGGRVVLARAALPGVLDDPVKVGAPLVGEDEAFWLLQYAEGQYSAVGAQWTRPGTTERCPVVAEKQRAPGGAVWRAGAPCDGAWSFGPQGAPIDAPRGLDRYLVSVSGERVIVNISRRLQGVPKTPKPSASPPASPSRRP